MQPFKQLSLVILGVSSVVGDYWWMNNGGAFGGNSEAQIKSEPSGGYGGGYGGYGGGGGNRNSQTVNPQNTEEYINDESGFKQSSGGYPQNLDSYPTSTRYY